MRHLLRSIAFILVVLLAASVAAEDVPYYGLGSSFQGPPLPFRLCGVAPDGPAARAGLRAGDAIVAFDGRTSFEGQHELLAFLFSRNVSEPLAVTFMRDGQERSVSFVPRRATPEQAERSRNLRARVAEKERR